MLQTLTLLMMLPLWEIVIWEIEKNLHRIEETAQKVGLLIIVSTTKNMGVSFQRPMASTSVQQNEVEILTGCYKGQTGFLREIDKVWSLSIGTEVLEGTKKKAGWFETLRGDKIRLKHLTCETSLNGPPEPTNESKVCSKCRRCFDTVVGQKVHESRYCKKAEENTKHELVKPIGAKFKNFEKSLRCNRCQHKFKSVNGRKVHEARYCGKLKARVTRIFSSSVKDASDTEFESVQAFKYLGSHVSLQDVMQKKLSVNWLNVGNASVIFRTSGGTSN